MSFRAELTRRGAVAWKDLTTERRSKANFNAVVFLAALMLLMFGFALGPDTATLRASAAGILWLTVLFSGNLAFHRSYQVELEGGRAGDAAPLPGRPQLDLPGEAAGQPGLRAPGGGGAGPAGHHPLRHPLTGHWVLVLVVFLGTFGFVTLGTFYASMASRSRAREVLLPLLLFPMLVPVLVAAVEGTASLLAGDPWATAAGGSSCWWRSTSSSSARASSRSGP
jgi:heme exporter protein B